MRHDTRMNEIFRPKTRGELRDKLKEGVPCEVVTWVTDFTVIMFRDWLNFTAFTTRPSLNEGWTIFEPKQQETPK